MYMFKKAGDKGFLFASDPIDSRLNEIIGVRA